MLIADLYTIHKNEITDEVQTVEITLNPDSHIFKGHFPDNPVTPGVCMLQIIKELTEDRVGHALFMKKASNVKFLAVINPEKTPDLVITNRFKDTEEGIKIQSIFTFGDVIALKVTLIFAQL
ncbi:3-hydroxyacyl-ACP dehydratase [Aquimarina addita]|uniref:3-hydroxyacyl-ACP dehydratase n=1 Tax=Aquimarina addita TaxID=870485 RepID=A0ABP6UKK5_9FLAO